MESVGSSTGKSFLLRSSQDSFPSLIKAARKFGIICNSSIIRSYVSHGVLFNTEFRPNTHRHVPCSRMAACLNPWVRNGSLARHNRSALSMNRSPTTKSIPGHHNWTGQEQYMPLLVEHSMLSCPRQFRLDQDNLDTPLWRSIGMSQKRSSRPFGSPFARETNHLPLVPLSLSGAWFRIPSSRMMRSRLEIYSR